ncbi:MAG TPA: hypothetical protein VFQ00_12045 [Terriglobales bacterium]|nr:hypothetical protein [Terriglobales bacterium]
MQWKKLIWSNKANGTAWLLIGAITLYPAIRGHHSENLVFGIGATILGIAWFFRDPIKPGESTLISLNINGPNIPNGESHRNS